jgi:ABC-type sugar transport system ATPase subunit
MYDVIQRVRQHTGVTALHVTHSMSEATGLADALFVFEDGVIQQRPIP